MAPGTETPGRPTGWIFRARKLVAELSVKATGKAVVIQDKLKNTYQLY